MHLFFDKLMRTETDEDIINTLKRKGWQEIDPPSFDPETEYYTWNDGEWIVLKIPDEHRMLNSVISSTLI